jgi:DNA-binding response OmpR family regulator
MGSNMSGPLVGHIVLIVEDEPLVALDVADCLRDAGAETLMARTVRDAIRKAVSAEFTAAVLDHGLSDGDTSEVCETLTGRSIPFVVYSGYSKLQGPCSDGELVRKPATPQHLVSRLVEALAVRPT